MSELSQKVETASDSDLMPVTEQERKLIEVLRKLDYGEVRIVLRGSEIVQVEEKKSIKL